MTKLTKFVVLGIMATMGVHAVVGFWPDSTRLRVIAQDTTTTTHDDDTK